MVGLAFLAVGVFGPDGDLEVGGTVGVEGEHMDSQSAEPGASEETVTVVAAGPEATGEPETAVEGPFEVEACLESEAFAGPEVSVVVVEEAFESGVEADLVDQEPEEASSMGMVVEAVVVAAVGY